MEYKPENQALKDCQRIFVHMMVYEGLDRLEAYVESHDVDLTEENEKNVKARAARLFYRPNVNRYYHALLEEIRELEVKKGLWTREIATEKLVRLMERAEAEIYGDTALNMQPGKITMAKMNAIVLPAKELNSMHGFNQTNVNVEGVIVQIVGEEDIPD